MASFYKRGDYQWEAKIRKVGFPQLAKTFETKADAVAWAAEVETEMRRGTFVSRAEAERKTLGDLIGQYVQDVSPLMISFVVNQEQWQVGHVLVAGRITGVSDMSLDPLQKPFQDSFVLLDDEEPGSLLGRDRKVSGDLGIEVAPVCAIGRAVRLDV